MDRSLGRAPSPPPPAAVIALADADEEEELMRQIDEMPAADVDQFSTDEFQSFLRQVRDVAVRMQDPSEDWEMLRGKWLNLMESEHFNAPATKSLLNQLGLL